MKPKPIEDRLFAHLPMVERHPHFAPIAKDILDAHYTIVALRKELAHLRQPNVSTVMAYECGVKTAHIEIQEACELLGGFLATDPPQFKTTREVIIFTNKVRRYIKRHLNPDPQIP